MWTGKVVVFSKPSEALRVQEETSPCPNSSEVLVRMLMAGVCGSDAHRLSGDVPAPPASICFGHEAVGRIEALGDNVKTDRMGTPLAVGDMLYWMPSTPCGRCWECSISNPLQCKDLNWPVAAGGPNAAGFREYATLSERCIFIRIPEDTNPASVIAFGCAMPTALRAFSKLERVGPRTDIVIQGAGPVGLASVLLAGLAGARNIIVIGEPPQRLEVAKSLGATTAFSLSGTSVEERRERIQSLTDGRGASAVIEAAGAIAAFPEGFDLLGLNGRYIIVGLWSGKAVGHVDLIRVNNLNLQIIGSLGIDINEYHQTVEIARKHGERLHLAKLITHRYHLDDIESAIKTVAKGESVKTIVTP